MNRPPATAKHSLVTSVVYEWDGDSRHYRILASEDGRLGWEVEPAGVSYADVHWDFLHAIAELARQRRSPAEAVAEAALQRAQLEAAGLLEEFAAHVGCDLVEWLADALVAARAGRRGDLEVAPEVRP